MFLNAALRDFEDAPSGQYEDLIDLELALIQDIQQTKDLPGRLPGRLAGPSSLVLRPTGFSSMNFSYKESRLWDYFVNFITPQCAVSLAANPYRNVVLRIAAAAPHGPLFQCVMAIAASQMNRLRHGEPKTSSWEFRASALKSLRRHLDASQHEPEEAIATVVMMSFLEVSNPQVLERRGTLQLMPRQILEDCSPSWIVHADFGETLLASHKTTIVTNPDLYHFLMTWLIVHKVFASTAWVPKSGDVEITTLLASVNEECVQTLTGCSKSQLCLLAGITALADIVGSGLPALDEAEMPKREAPIRGDDRAAAKKERDRIERQLCQAPPPNNTDFNLAGNEIRAISELKRLATLMYLYARIDESSPYEPHMARLAEKILEILPRIPLRTNTILWPLFILGTLGVRPESDDHRKIVLQMLNALQTTRQLGCVRKARKVIEDVWKARDLKSIDSVKGWSILEGRHGNISLA